MIAAERLPTLRSCAADLSRPRRRAPASTLLDSDQENGRLFPQIFHQQKGHTLPDIHPPERQKPLLLALQAALGSAPRAPRRDACSDWNIEGQHGHIYSIPGALGEPGRECFQFFIFCDSGMAWTYAKRALKFATICNDGDEEGGFIMHRLPTKAEAETIRRYLGIPKRREVGEPSAAQLAARTAFAARALAKAA
jgi:hypothetical protein